MSVRRLAVAALGGAMVAYFLIVLPAVLVLDVRGGWSFLLGMVSGYTGANIAVSRLRGWWAR